MEKYIINQDVCFELKPVIERFSNTLFVRKESVFVFRKNAKKLIIEIPNAFGTIEVIKIPLHLLIIPLSIDQIKDLVKLKSTKI